MAGTNKVTCPQPNCGSDNVRPLSRKYDNRPVSQVGTLDTPQVPVSTTIKYACTICGHEWTETVKL